MSFISLRNSKTYCGTSSSENNAKMLVWLRDNFDQALAKSNTEEPHTFDIPCGCCNEHSIGLLTEIFDDFKLKINLDSQDTDCYRFNVYA